MSVVINSTGGGAYYPNGDINHYGHLNNVMNATPSRIILNSEEKVMNIQIDQIGNGEISFTPSPFYHIEQINANMFRVFAQESTEGNIHFISAETKDYFGKELNIPYKFLPLERINFLHTSERVYINEIKDLPINFFPSNTTDDISKLQTSLLNNSIEILPQQEKNCIKIQGKNVGSDQITATFHGPERISATCDINVYSAPVSKRDLNLPQIQEREKVIFRKNTNAVSTFSTLMSNNTKASHLQIIFDQVTETSFHAVVQTQTDPSRILFDYLLKEAVSGRVLKEIKKSQYNSTEQTGLEPGTDYLLIVTCFNKEDGILLDTVSSTVTTRGQAMRKVEFHSITSSSSEILVEIVNDPYYDNFEYILADSLGTIVERFQTPRAVYTFYNLIPNTNYEVNVTGFHNGYRQASNSRMIRTQNLNTPLGIEINDITENSLSVEVITDYSGLEGGYNWYLDNKLVNSTPANNKIFTFYDLLSNTEYVLKVKELTTNRVTEITAKTKPHSILLKCTPHESSIDAIITNPNNNCSSYEWYINGQLFHSAGPSYTFRNLKINSRYHINVTEVESHQVSQDIEIETIPVREPIPSAEGIETFIYGQGIYIKSLNNPEGVIMAPPDSNYLFRDYQASVIDINGINFDIALERGNVQNMFNYSLQYLYYDPIAIEDVQKFKQMTNLPYETRMIPGVYEEGGRY